MTSLIPATDNSIKLKSLPDHELLARLENLVLRERQVVESLIRHLQEVQDRKLYISMGYTSLFECLVKHFKYSEAVAYSRISVLRIIHSVPETKVALQRGEVSLSTLSLTQSFIQKQEKEFGQKLPHEIRLNYISAIKNKSTQETKELLATISPAQELPIDKVKYLSDSKAQLQITVDNDLLEKIERLKNLISHENINPSHNEILHMALDTAIEKKEKAKGIFVKKQREDKSESPEAAAATTLKKQSGSMQAQPLTQSFADKNHTKSRYISRQVKRLVLNRSQYQCEFVHPSGQRCASKFQLQFDHIKAYSRGGSSDLVNIQNLCRVHNNWKGSQISW